MPARDLPLLVAGALSLRLPRGTEGAPAKQKTMLLECLALSAPRDWDAHKWEQQRASLRETVLSLAAGVYFRGLVGEPLRVFSRPTPRCAGFEPASGLYR